MNDLLSSQAGDEVDEEEIETTMAMYGMAFGFLHSRQWAQKASLNFICFAFSFAVAQSSFRSQEES